MLNVLVCSLQTTYLDQYSLFISTHTHTHTHTHIYIYICVCVCVCVKIDMIDRLIDMNKLK